MKHDPIVQEVRATRQKIFDACDNDLEKLMDRYQLAENKDRDRLVALEKLKTKSISPAQTS